MALSALARVMRKQKMLKFGIGARRRPRSPVPEGFARGAMGVQGTPGLKSRNPDAGENKDRQTLGMPEMPSSNMFK